MQGMKKNIGKTTYRKISEYYSDNSSYYYSYGLLNVEDDKTFHKNNVDIYAQIDGSIFSDKWISLGEIIADKQ